MTLRQRPGCKSLWFVFIKNGGQQRHTEGNGKYAEHEKSNHQASYPPDLQTRTHHREKQQTKQRNKRKEKKKWQTSSPKTYQTP